MGLPQRYPSFKPHRGSTRNPGALSLGRKHYQNIPEEWFSICGSQPMAGRGVCVYGCVLVCVCISVCMGACMMSVCVCV